jgi:hypothetical protein
MTAASKTVRSAARRDLAAHRIAMNSRNRFSFGRTFLETLAAGKSHHDAGKLSAFLVANGVETAETIKTKAKAGKLTLESMSKSAAKLIAKTSPDKLVMKFNLNAN